MQSTQQLMWQIYTIHLKTNIFIPSKILSILIPVILSPHDLISAISVTKMMHLFLSFFFSLICFLIMGGIMEEKSVLKIVYPNRRVEIHKQPVTAAEILKKHPRHSVTRPDVFEYPWIVVNPESVLTLGKVFFIVPNLTIYNLLKQHKERHQQPPHHCQSPMINNVKKQVQNRNSVGKTIRQQLNDRQPLRLLPLLPMASCIGMGSEDREESYRKVKNPSRVESWSMLKFRETNSDTKDKLLEDSSRSCRKNGKNDGDLKSCLRKKDSVRKLLNLKVSFDLTEEDEEQQIGVYVSEADFSGNFRTSLDFFLHSTKVVPNTDFSISPQNALHENLT